MRLGSIYSLIDPRTNRIRYIGQTIVNPKRRYDQHIYQWKRSIGKINKINSWIKSLSKLNLKPIMNILENNILEKDLDQKEIDYIKKYRNLNYKLCNHTDGGKGNRGFKFSEESKKKRLETLRNSDLWKERSLRHSEIMKEKHKDKSIIFGYNHLSENKKLEIRQKQSKTIKELYSTGQIKNRKNKVLLYNDNFSKEFESVKATAEFLNLTVSSIQRCCKYKEYKLKGIYYAKYLDKK